MDVCHGIPCGFNDPAPPSMPPTPIERLRIAAEAAELNSMHFSAEALEAALARDINKLSECNREAMKRVNDAEHYRRALDLLEAP